MDINSCVKVTFRAKVKNEIPSDLSEKIRSEAKGIDGFISMETITDDDIETTTSYWKSMISVREWSQNELHIEAKNNADKYYEWTKFELEENQPYPTTLS